IGKSALWLAGVDYARAQERPVLASRPAEAERSLAYVGIGDLFERVLDEVLPRLSRPRRRALEGALLVEDTAPDAVDSRALGLAGALGLEVDLTQPLPVPQTLEGLLRARLTGLPATTREALGLAAALGAPSSSLLERAGVDPQALDAAVVAQVIERADGTLRFSHPLLSSVLYAELGDE